MTKRIVYSEKDGKAIFGWRLDDDVTGAMESLSTCDAISPDDIESEVIHYYEWMNGGRDEKVAGLLCRFFVTYRDGLAFTVDDLIEERDKLLEENTRLLDELSEARADAAKLEERLDEAEEAANEAERLEDSAISAEHEAQRTIEKLRAAYTTARDEQIEALRRMERAEGRAEGLESALHTIMAEAVEVLR